MTKEQRKIRKQENKNIQKNLPRLITEKCSKDEAFAKDKNIISMLMLVWVATRILLVADNAFVCAKLGTGMMYIGHDITQVVVVCVFAEAIKKGEKSVAILPLIGVAVSIFTQLDNIPIYLNALNALNANYGYVVANGWILIIALAYQVFSMLYILLAPQSKRFTAQVNILKEEAKKMTQTA